MRNKPPTPLGRPNLKQVECGSRICFHSPLVGWRIKATITSCNRGGEVDQPTDLPGNTQVVYFFQSSLSLSSLTRRRFYPQRYSSGQVVLAGVVPSPPPYVPPFLSRIRFIIPTARRCFIEFCYFTIPRFPLINLTRMRSVRLETHEIDLSGHADHLPSHRGRRSASEQ